MKLLQKTLLAILVAWASTTAFPVEPKISFDVPEGIDYKTEKKEGQLLQMFRLKQHPSDPNYWGMDLPSFVVFEVPVEQYQQFVSDFEEKGLKAVEQEMLSQLSSQPGISEPEVSVNNLQIDGLNGYAVSTKFTISGAGVTNQMYSVWFEIEDSFWMGTGSSLRGKGDLDLIQAILETAKVGKHNQSE